jgi:hypothetical protein
MVEVSIIVIDRPLIQVRHISDRIELSSLPSLGNPPMTKEKKPDKGSKAHPKKKNFSSFNTKEAYQQLKIKTLLPWDHAVKPASPSDFFQERMARLQRHFDLKTCEDSKKLLIDAVCEEALEGFDQIKIWKGAILETTTTTGVADYLIAENKGYLETPYLCIVEAKKDNFEQGLAQCLVEMQACQWENQQVQRSIDILGVVSNGDAWAFYKLATNNKVYETTLYALSDLETVLGWLKYIFHLSEENLG